VSLFARRNLRDENALVIKLPVIFTKDTMYWLIKNLFRALSDRPKTIAFDFAKLQSIQVGGITTLSNIIEYCRNLGFKIVFRNAGGCAATHFLQGSGLLTQYQSVPADSVARKHFLPLQLVEYDRSFNHVHNQLIPWLAGILGHEERALTSLKAGLGEVFNNIKDHSTVNVGCSASHYDATEDKITICVSDIGIGIPGRVRQKIDLASDQAAIAMACQHGFSTKTTPRNRGAGLHVLIQNVVARNHGTVIIYSGGGIYSTVHNPDGPLKGTGRAAPGQYPGTMIYMTLPRSEFVPDDIDEEEFQWD
jgi:anti-sigma regulatory factor (Ser/Thr protein kinase)